MLLSLMVCDFLVGVLRRMGNIVLSPVVVC